MSSLRVPAWLLEILSNTVSVGLKLKSQKQGILVQHDFHHVTRIGNGGALQVCRGSCLTEANEWPLIPLLRMQIAQARFPTRIRKGASFVQITDCQGTKQRAKVASARGKTLVLTTDSHIPRSNSIQSIHFRDDQAGADEKDLKFLWFKVC